MYELELPLFAAFVDYCSHVSPSSEAENPATEDSDVQWNELVELVGRKRFLNPKTASFVTPGYTSITRLGELLGRLGLLNPSGDSKVIYEQLIRLKIAIGARSKMLLLHDIGGSLCYRDKD